MRSWEGRPRGKCGLIGSLILLVPNVVVNSGAGTGGSLNVIRISPSLGRNGLRKRGETSMSKQERKEREYITNDPTWPQDKVEASAEVLEEMERQEREEDLRKRFAAFLASLKKEHRL
jgi:hypothetical protein